MKNSKRKGNRSRAIAQFIEEAHLVIGKNGVVSCGGSGIAKTVVTLDMPEKNAVGGAVASVKVVFNKSVFNKTVLNKNKNKNKNKLTSPAIGGLSGGLMPTDALLKLHQMGTMSSQESLPFAWTNIDLPAPPGPDHTRVETQVLLEMQASIKVREARRADIERESTLDISNFTRPLGIDGLAGFEATESLFLELITVCEYIGLYYKSVYGRLRPNQIEARMRPLLANPAHAAYPSNHAFQCYSIVYAFNTLLPEHPATNELSLIALNVAQNREWAGLHYPSDTEAGRSLARRLSPYFAEAFSDKFRAVQQEWL